MPQRFTDRWGPGRSGPSYDDSVCWHLLLGCHPEVRSATAEAKQRLEGFSGLSMTPTRWLHVTVLLAGPAEKFTQADMESMLAVAQAGLDEVAPVPLTLGRVFYHPEAIAVEVRSADALRPIYDAAHAATHALTRVNRDTRLWAPHLTLCYSTGEQPAAPVIEAVGRELSSREFTVDQLSLVVQQGSEREWDWKVAGTARLLGTPRASMSI